MTPDQQAMANDIFLEVAELSSMEERTAYLGRRCEGLDAEVREEVERLLEADAAATEARFSQLDVPLADMIASTAPPSLTEKVGGHLGPFRLLQQLGEGGMGVVYLAEQKQPVRRRVALKVIKPGMDSKQVIARFEAERQALALMDHPNIAKVLEVGTAESGRPYFVMELVKGVPITQYCDENQLSVKERLELFLLVCQAVQHAHHKGVIHRDLKPSNVLVADFDNTPVPKVIDFGLAKAVQQNLTDKTLFTQIGQIVGTYEYMSPEQSKLNQLDIDTRTDVYSLGVLLYELLTGTTPFDSTLLRRAAFEEMLRIIREVEPPRPSDKLSTSNESAELATKRSSEPKKLASTIRGDLDAIIVKSLEKERAARYETCTSLADDVKRFLNDEPVTAARPSTWYYASRFVRRHRFAAATTCAIVTVVLASWALTAVKWVEAKRLAAIATAHLMSSDAALLGESKPVKSLLLQREINTVAGIANLESVELKSREVLLRDVTSIGGIPLVAPDLSIAQDIDLAANGDWALTHHGDKLCLWHLPTMGTKSEPLVLTNVISWCTSRDGKVLHTADRDGSIRSWDLSEPTARPTTNDFEAMGSVTSFDIGPDGRWIAFRSEDGALMVREATTKQDTALKRLDDPGYVVEITSTGKWLIAHARKQPILLWQLDRLQESKEPIKIPNARPIFVSADGRWLVNSVKVKQATAYIPMIHVFDLETDDPKSNVVFSAAMDDIESNALGISQDGGVIVAGSAELALWRSPQGQPTTADEKTVLRGHNGFLNCLDLAPDGRWLATGGFDATVRVWDLSKEEPQSVPLQGQDSYIHEVRVSSNGRWVISLSDAGARLWDMDSQTSQFSGLRLAAADPTDDYYALRNFSFSSDSRWLATATRQSRVRVWDLSYPFPALSVVNPIADYPMVPIGQECIAGAALSPDGNWLIGATGTRDAILWNLKWMRNTTPIQLRHPAHVEWQRAVTMSPDNRWAITGGSDGVARVFDLQAIRDTAGEVVEDYFELSGHSGPIDIIAVSQDSNWLVTSDSSNEKRVLLWDLTVDLDAAEPYVLLEPIFRVFAITFTAGGRKLLVGGSGEKKGKLLEWDMSTWPPKEPTKLIDDSEAGIWRLAASPNRRWIAAARFGGFQLIDLEKSGPPTTFDLNEAWTGCASVDISPDNRWLAVGSGHGEVLLWKLESIRAGGLEPDLVLQGHRSQVWTIKFSPDSRWLVSGGQGEAILWPMRRRDLQEISGRLAGRKLTEAERSLYEVLNQD